MKAFIFDLNGTMINDMDYHTSAWLDVMNNNLGGNFTYEEVKPQMYGKNSEVLERMFGDGYFSKEQMEQISMEKEKQYQKAYLPHLKLLPGLQGFIEKRTIIKSQWLLRQQPSLSISISYSTT